jgi:cyclic nucleotide gated channel, plant
MMYAFSLYFCYLPQNVGTLWYFLTIKREDDCWRMNCHSKDGCDSSYLYCSDHHNDNYINWLNGNATQMFKQCDGLDDDSVNFGIYQQALVSGILGPGHFISKVCYCFWWGLQNLR